MSAGGLVLAPAVVPAVAAGAIVIGAAVVVGGAILVARAASAAIEGSVRIIGEQGELVEARVAAIEASAEAALRWEVAAADVVSVNARIRLLRERVAEAGVPVAVPPPVKLSSSCEPAELSRMARVAQIALAKAQAELDGKLPPLRLGLVSAREIDDRTSKALAGYEQALRRRYEVAVTAPVSPPDVSQQDVDSVLALLDPDATTAERNSVLEAAEMAELQPHNADMYVSEMRTRINVINPKVARRRVAASWLESLEDGPLPHPPADMAETVDRLRQVVAGSADLGPEDRTRGLRMLAWVEETRRQQLVRELVSHCLEEDGYHVDETFDVQNTVGLRLSKEDWNGQHSADVWVDRNGLMHARVVRASGARSADARLTDETRCAEFATALEQAGEKLVIEGSRVKVVMDRNAPVQAKSESRQDSTRVHAPNAQAREMPKGN
ncbi:hypothetical protein ABZ345_08645 [Lentzea sp. NPDC005914]|uniref:hypothetical protein n=1 Tax=Lentzea sp. NPDC005914 TaxID=3154572 RepID=UPI0034047B4F